MFFLKVCLFFALFCHFPLAFAIYDLKTQKEATPPSDRHYLLISEGCHSCLELIGELGKLCSGKKPTSSKLGFFVIGSKPKILMKKLSDFETGYLIFAGSPNEFYQAYQMMGTPSLRARNQKGPISGKGPILKFLKKDQGFCSNS